MLRRVRKNQSIDNVTYYGEDILLVDQSQDLRLESKNREVIYNTTVIICEGSYLGLGAIEDDGGACYYALWHDPFMWWNDYTKYFGIDARVLVCYLRKDRGGLEDAAQELASYVNKHIFGKILLVGQGKGGIMMYVSAGQMQIIDKQYDNPRRSVTLMTIGTPFGGTPFGIREEYEALQKEHTKLIDWWYNKIYFAHKGNLEVGTGSEFLRKIKGLPENVRHMAFVSVISSEYDKQKSKNIRVWAMKKLDKWANIKGDGIVSIASQVWWPIKKRTVVIKEKGFTEIRNEEREPDWTMIVNATHVDAMEIVLKDFGKYAGYEFMFELFEDFVKSDIVKRLYE